jgi:hypothetical protein
MLNVFVASSNIVKQKGPGRPPTIAGERFVGIRLPRKTVDHIDRWAAASEVSRSEAIRRLIELGLKAKR